MAVSQLPVQCWTQMVMKMSCEMSFILNNAPNSRLRLNHGGPVDGGMALRYHGTMVREWNNTRAICLTLLDGTTHFVRIHPFHGKYQGCGLVLL